MIITDQKTQSLADRITAALPGETLQFRGRLRSAYRAFSAVAGSTLESYRLTEHDTDHGTTLITHRDTGVRVEVDWS